MIKLKLFFKSVRLFVVGIFCVIMSYAVSDIDAFAGIKADNPILVFGHLNPDTDSVAAAIAGAHLLNSRGIAAVPRVQGPLNKESTLVLKKFNLATPELLKGIAKQRVGIVDFSDLAQGPADLKEAEVVFIVDHHKLGDVTTKTPLEAWILPVGSTNTVLHEMYAYYNVEIPKDIAGAMLAAILSDTVIFKSVTTTELDKKVAARLARIAGVTDMEAFGIELFNAKSDVAGASAMSLVMGDMKIFEMSGKKVAVGQLELVDLKLINSRKTELFAAMKELKKEKGLHSTFFLLTDVMQEASMLLAVTDDVSIVKKAFGKELERNELWLPGVMSRKKQVIPNLERAFQ